MMYIKSSRSLVRLYIDKDSNLAKRIHRELTRNEWSDDAQRMQELTETRTGRELLFIDTYFTKKFFVLLYQDI